VHDCIISLKGEAWAHQTFSRVSGLKAVFSGVRCAHLFSVLCFVFVYVRHLLCLPNVANFSGLFILYCFSVFSSIHKVGKNLAGDRGKREIYVEGNNPLLFEIWIFRNYQPVRDYDRIFFVAIGY
jgi:hypothetical protein